MPAITVEDVLVLPRLPRLDPATTTFRPVRRLTTAPSGYEGEGFPVRRAFAGVPMHELDPFIHLDQMGEVDYAPGEPKGTPWHPHRGFETVTYMIDGTMDHQDSNGGGGVITDGDTQWMTAGGGILHIEAPPEEVVMRGGLFHGFQLWVNLPARLKMTPPRYQDIRGRAVTLLSSPDGGALLRVIAGEIAGQQGPAGPPPAVGALVVGQPVTRRQVAQAVAKPPAALGPGGGRERQLHPDRAEHPPSGRLAARTGQSGGDQAGEGGGGAPQTGRGLFGEGEVGNGTAAGVVRAGGLRGPRPSVAADGHAERLQHLGLHV